MFSGTINTTKKLEKPEINITEPKEKETSQCFPPPLKPEIKLDLNPPPPEGWEKIKENLEPLNTSNSLPRPQQINYNPVSRLIQLLRVDGMKNYEIMNFVKVINEHDEQCDLETIRRSSDDSTLIGIKYECRRTNEKGCIVLNHSLSNYYC